MRAINAARFSKVMRELSRVQSRASAEISRNLKAEIERRMDASQDPYGKPWPKKADGRRSTLHRTGKGRASILAYATSGAGLRVTIGILYMVFHQFGGKSHLRGHRKHPDFGRDKDRSAGRNRPPQRAFLPFERVPKEWQRIMQAAINNAARRVLDGQ